MKNPRFLPDFKRHRFLWGSLTVLCLTGAFWWYDTNRDPNIVIPPAPVAPKPNGFDFFVKAAQAYVAEPHSLIIEKEPEPDPKNAKIFNQKYPLKAREAWIQQNAEALRLLRQGLKYQSQYPPRTDYMRPYSNFRGLGRLLISESHVFVAKGDWNKAAQPALECIRFGQEVRRGGPNVAWILGSDSSMRGIKALQQTVDRLDAPTAKNTAHQLESMLKTAPSVTDALHEEKWMQLQSYRSIFSQSNWRAQFATVEARWEQFDVFLDSMATGRKPTYWDSAKVLGVYAQGRARMLSYSKRRLTQNYIAVADAAIAASQQPYRNIKPARGADIFSDIFVDSYARNRWSYTLSRVNYRQLIAALALRAYKLEKGSYPASLNALVPAYLPSVPLDVFVNKPLRYKREGASYKLWSIGPDRKDDGGKPARDTTKFPNRQTIVDSASIGDFVFGVNR